MHAEAAHGTDAILVDDAQSAKSHVLGIVILIEGKRVIGVEPSMLEMAAFFRRAQRDHSRFLCRSVMQERCCHSSGCGVPETAFCTTEDTPTEPNPALFPSTVRRGRTNT